MPANRYLTLFRGAAAIGLVGASLLAAPARADISAMVKLGYDFGGDTLTTVPFTDGTTASIDTNEGLLLGGGVAIANADYTWQTEVTLSWKYQAITAANGDLKWTRWPLEAVTFYQLPQFRFGGGLTYHLNPTLEGDGVVSNINMDFDNALGFVLQADYRLDEAIAFGLRYTVIEYESGGRTYDASGPGLSFSAVF